MKGSAMGLAVLIGLTMGLVVQAGDYDGDGTDDVGIFRPSTGLWAIRGVSRCYFGDDSDGPLTGDFNGDGTDDIAINRPFHGLWAIKDVTRLYFGTSEDIPLDGVVVALSTDGILWHAAGDDIYFDSGNVGIGTTSPQAKLHVADGVIRQTLPKTGQRTSYRTGDDGYHQAGQDVIHDNGDGTLTDLQTGLVWPSDGDWIGYTCSGDWNWAIDWANSLTLAGYDDWRLPNINEFKRLQEITWGYYSGSMGGAYFWTSTTSSRFDSYALFGCLHDRGQYVFPENTKATMLCAVAVRGPD